MQKFEFALERSLKIRKQQERLAELDVIRASAHLDASRAKLEDLQQKLHQLSQRMTQQVGRTFASSEWSSYADQANHLGQSITQAKQVILDAEQALFEANKKRTLIATEVEAFKTLRQEKLEEFQHTLRKFEQERVDEAGLRRFLSANSEVEG